MQAYAELLPPTAVTHGISLPFRGVQTEDIIIAKSSLLQIFEVVAADVNKHSKENDHSINGDGDESNLKRRARKLRLVAEYRLSGVITSLARVKALDASNGGEILLVSFRDAKVSLIEWNSEIHSISTVSIHYYETDDLLGSPWAPDPRHCSSFMLADPLSRCAALKFGLRHLALIPFRQPTDDLTMEDYDPTIDETPSATKNESAESTLTDRKPTPYDASFVLLLTELDPNIVHLTDLAFLYEYREPTLGVLSASKSPSVSIANERRDVHTYTAFSLDLQQRASTALISVTGLPSDLFKVFPLPLPVGGVLLIGANELVHIDQAGKTNAVAVNEFATEMSNFGMTDFSDMGLRLEGSVVFQISTRGDVLIVLSNGEFVLVKFRIDGRSVSGFSLRRVSSDHGGSIFKGMPSCAIKLNDEALFLGSEHTDSMLIDCKYGRPSFGKKRTHSAMDEVYDGSVSEDDIEDDDDLYGEGTALSKSNSQSTASVGFDEITFNFLDGLPNLTSNSEPCFGKKRTMSWSMENVQPTYETGLELAIATGLGEDSSVTFLTRSIVLDQFDTLKADAAEQIWVLSSPRETEKGPDSSSQSATVHVISSGRSRDGSMTSNIYKMMDLELIKPAESDFETDTSTLNAGVLLSGTRIVQICLGEVRCYPLDRESPMKSDRSFGAVEDLHCEGLTIYSEFTCVKIFNHIHPEPANELVPNLNSRVPTIPVQSHLSFPQIFPMTDEETEMDLKIVHSAVLDPYILIVRDDGSCLFLKTDEKGELDEMVTGDTLRELRWISGALYMRQASELKVLAYLLSADGMLMILDLSNLEKPLCTIENINHVPMNIGPGITYRRSANREKFIEVVVADLGDEYSLTTYLIFRTINDGIIMYQPFNADPNSQDTPFEYYRWAKVLEHAGTIEDAEEEEDTDDGNSRSRKPVRVIETDRHRSLFVASEPPVMIFKETASMPQALRIFDRDVVCIEALPAAQLRCLVAKDSGELLLATFPPDTHYGVPGCSFRRLSQYEQVEGICYHSETDLYAASLNVPTEFSLPDDDDWHPEWAKEGVTLKPQTTTGIVRLIDPRSSSILSEMATEDDEVILCIKTLNMEISETTHERKNLVVVGTAIMRGEDQPSNGAIYVYDIIPVVPDPERPETNRSLKLLVREEVKGAVTCLSEIGDDGFVLVAQGQKLMVRGLKEDQTLLPIAFLDVQTQATALKNVKGTGMALTADAVKGTWLIGFASDPYRMRLFGKSRSSMQAVAAEVLTFEKQLFILVMDANCDLHVLEFNPEDPMSLSGQRLLSRSSFHTGQFASSMLTVPTSLQLYATTTDGDANMTNGDESPPRTEQSVLITTQSGAIALITPINEQTYRRLGALQNHLTTLLDHPCGLNPRAFRAVESEAAGGRGVLDGQILLRWHMLSSQRKAEACARVGATADIVRRDLASISGGGLDYF